MRINSRQLVLAGLGLGAAAFFGCQVPVGDTAQGNGAVPSDLSLRLVEKTDSGCVALKAQIAAATDEAAAKAAGAAYLTQCVEQVTGEAPKAPDTGAPKVTPDDRTKCDWIKLQVDGGKADMAPKFRYYCKDDCEKWSQEDTAAHDRYCVDGVVPPSCDQLKSKLALLDSTSPDYAGIRHAVGEACHEEYHPPVAPSCDSLKKLLSGLLPGTEAYAKAQAAIAATCKEGEGKDSASGSKDGGNSGSGDSHPGCEDLNKKLSTLDPASADYAAVKAQIAQACQPAPAPAPKPNCDSLRILLKGMDTTSHDYIELRTKLRLNCGDGQPVPPVVMPPSCDSLRVLLAKVDTNSEQGRQLMHDFADRCAPKPVPAPVPAPKPNCDSLRALLKGMDTTSHDYMELRTKIRLNCGDGQPLPPPPAPKPNCDSLRLVLKGMDTASHDYAELRTKLQLLCGDGQPAPVPQPPKVNCDSLRLVLKATDSTSEAYAKIKSTLQEHCGLVAPAPQPAPVVVNCDELRAKLAALTPGTEDYIRIAGSLKEHCPAQ